MKVLINTYDITRIQALTQALGYSGTLELEVDSSSGIGTTIIAHIPQSINSLKGTFSYVISNEEDW